MRNVPSRLCRMHSMGEESTIHHSETRNEGHPTKVGGFGVYESVSRGRTDFGAETGAETGAGCASERKEGAEPEGEGAALRHSARTAAEQCDEDVTVGARVTRGAQHAQQRRTRRRRWWAR